ncbi:multidrug effflux MFS transporter [Rhodovastum sp. RN2-1]|uniref:Bcr/CflA family efflux transporter n=1 Tax=Limobrevibacterium gyesilva TaxID=2991712 RepID=A0AA41YS60_9PROT|nr:multidrug effflux MFS transporter [Limobrevibacterium gyesilva]MCW3474477.1 multidrug effflux MFS transporter [Limobrevibacterium gyesilva]
MGGATQPPLWLIFALVISGTMSMHIFVPALPVAARDLGVSNGAIQLTITLYLVGLAGGQLLYGPLSDRFGRRPVLLGGLLLYAAGGMVAGLAPGLGTLVVARVVQALGGCSGLVLGRAILRDVSSAREAAAKLALLNLFMSVSPAMAPLVGGAIATFLGWRAIFALLAFIGTLTLLTALATLPETHQPQGGGRPAGMLGSYLRLLGSPAFRGLTIAGAGTTTSFYAFLAAAPFIIVDRLHRPAAEIGWYLAAPILGITLGSLIANRLVSRVDPMRLMRAGIVLAAIGAALFFAAEVTGHLTVVTMLASMLVFTVGTGTVSPLALTSAISAVPGMTGAASGLYGFTQMGFGAFCTLLVGLWHENPAQPAALVLLLSSLASLLALAAVVSRTRR